MKDAISGMGLYIIVIIFITVFATYVSVTTTYSRCFRIKDELVTVIEHYRGITKEGLDEMNKFLIGMGYSSSGTCPKDGKLWNAYSLHGKTGYGTQTNYCIAKNVTTSNKTMTANSVYAGVGMYNSAYYQVIVFFQLEWPILRNIFTIDIAGETQIITNPYDTEIILENVL